MTAFPALPELDDPFKPMLLEPEPVVTRPPRKIRAAATDSVINAQRAITPPSVTEQRTTKRMSVSELNTTDMGNLMERYQATKYDDRGPITRFLDLLDMPRNLIAGTLFPTLRRRKEAEGDIGTGGFGNVRFSDILDEMGVEPGIIRGVVGFVGDVAMDPLTYIGAPGWGMRLVGKGGKAIEGTAAGRRALENAFSAAARGAPVADAEAAAVIRTLGGDVLVTAAGKPAKHIEGELRNAVLGSKTGGKLSRVTEALGADIGTQGSALADAFFSSTKSEASEAARAFVAKHGTNAAPGIGIGVAPGAAKSAIAHIPFTSYGLYVPAFTGPAKEAAMIAARASAGFSEAAGPLGDDVKRLGDLHSQMRGVNDELRGLLDELHSGSAYHANDDNVLRSHGWTDAAIAQQSPEAKSRLAEVLRQEAATGNATIRDPRPVLEGLNEGDSIVDRHGTKWTMTGGALVSEGGSIAEVRPVRKVNGLAVRDEAGRPVRDFSPSSDAIRIAGTAEAHASGGTAIQEAIDALNEKRKGLLDQADKIVRGVDPQGLTGGLYEGLGPARPQNALDSIADVVHQEAQLKSLIDQSLDFENQMRDTVETVRKRKQLMSAISPEVGAKTDEILSQLRTEHEGMYGEGGLFRSEKPVDPRKVATEAPAPPANAPAPTPPQQANPAPATTGLASPGQALTDFGKGIAEGLYTSMIDRLKAGNLPEPFPESSQSSFAKFAKQAYDRGVVKTADDLKALAAQHHRNTVSDLARKRVSKTIAGMGFGSDDVRHVLGGASRAALSGEDELITIDHPLDDAMVSILNQAGFKAQKSSGGNAPSRLVATGHMTLTPEEIASLGSTPARPAAPAAVPVSASPTKPPLVPTASAAPEAIAQYEKDLAQWHEVHDFKTQPAKAEAKRRAMQAVLPNLDEGQRALLAIDPTEADIMEGVADSIHAEMKLRASQAEAIRGTIQETANRTDNRILADVAADMIGLGPSTGGYSAFTPIREITRSIFGDDHTVTQYANKKFDAMDEWVRKNFGMTKGEAGRARRSFEVSRDARAQAAYNNKLNQLTTEVKDILTKNGIDPENWEEAHDVTMALAYMQRMKAGENWSTLGSPIPGMLERAKAGPLAAAVNDLNELAKKHVGLLDSMTQDELMLKLLNENAIEGYMMGGATREGAQVLQGLGGSPAEQAAKASARTVQPFQREKSMARAVWQGPSGDTNAMYKFEYDFFRRMLDETGNLSDIGRDMLKAMQSQHPDVAGVAEDFWAAVRAGQEITPEMIARVTPWEKMAYLAGSYDKLPESFRFGQGSFKQVDAFLLNQEFPNRLGVMMPGQVIPRGMFETSFAEQMARRTAAHEKAQLATQFNEILGQHGSAIAKQVENQAVAKVSAGADSADIVFTNGAKGRIEKAANGEYVIRVGDKKYRKLRDMGEVQGALNQLGAGVYDPAGLVKYFPEPVAEAYERVAQAVKRPHDFIGVYDEFLRLWKTVTLAHPSWIIGDVAGGLIQALASGVNPLKFTQATPEAMKLAMALDKPDVLKAMKVTLGGKQMTGEEAVKLLNRYMIPSGHVHGEAFAKLVDGGVYLPEYTNRLLSKATLKDPIGAVKTRLREVRSRAGMRAKMTLDASKISDPLKGKLRGPLTAYNAVIPEAYIRNFLSPFMAMNARANDSMRIAAFMAFLNDGHDAAGAAAKVLDAMFDVGDLTRFETETMKRLIPFYSWMKHSGVYWTKRLMQNPALANMAPRVKRAVEEGLYGDDAVPDHLRPNWMRDQLALQIGSDPTKRYALTLGTAIPQETALGVGAALTSPVIGVAGLKQLLEQVGFGLALPIKAATELASGREAFSGRTIGFSPNEGDLTVGEYLTSQVRPLRELGVGNIREGPIQKALGSGVVPGASRLLLGGRSQPFDDDRIKQNLLKQFKESEQNIRKRITIAEREKNAGASTEARATLMRLYDVMVQRGLDEEVPAWARMQLEELHAGGG